MMTSFSNFRIKKNENYDLQTKYKGNPLMFYIREFASVTNNLILIHTYLFTLYTGWHDTFIQCRTKLLGRIKSTKCGQFRFNLAKRWLVRFAFIAEN